MEKPAGAHKIMIMITTRPRPTYPCILGTVRRKSHIFAGRLRIGKFFRVQCGNLNGIVWPRFLEALSDICLVVCMPYDDNETMLEVCVGSGEFSE